MSENKYTLWCVDRGPGFEESQYLGPFESEAQATDQADPDDEVRRCRRVMPSELPFDASSDYGGIISELDDLARGGELPAIDAWADFDDPVVLAKVSTDKAIAAFWAWADAHLEVKAFVCEGDEPARSDPEASP